jgi:glycerol-3-phosphate dehydrogenase
MRGAPVLNVFGGKITTYRRWPKARWTRSRRIFPKAGAPWTAGVPLPGGDFPVDGVEALVEDLRTALSVPDDFWARRLVRAYGTEARDDAGRRARRRRPGRGFRRDADRGEVAG